METSNNIDYRLYKMVILGGLSFNLLALSELLGRGIADTKTLQTAAYGIAILIPVQLAGYFLIEFISDYVLSQSTQKVFFTILLMMLGLQSIVFTSVFSYFGSSYMWVSLISIIISMLGVTWVVERWVKQKELAKKLTTTESKE